MAVLPSSGARSRARAGPRFRPATVFYRTGTYARLFCVPGWRAVIRGDKPGGTVWRPGDALAVVYRAEKTDPTTPRIFRPSVRTGRGEGANAGFGSDLPPPPLKYRENFQKYTTRFKRIQLSFQSFPTSHFTFFFQKLSPDIFCPRSPLFHTHPIRFDFQHGSPTRCGVTFVSFDFYYFQTVPVAADESKTVRAQ